VEIATMLPKPLRIRPIEALRALRVLLSNPDDTAQVFRIIEALSGDTPDRVLGRLRRSEQGKRLLAEKPDLLRHLLDRSRLSKLPDGTLGREYLRFLEREGITTEGLLEASEAGRRADRDLPPDLVYLRNRMRDQHDLWHVLVGLQGDLIGEASLLGFTFAQTTNPGIGVIVSAAWLRGREFGVRRMILDGIRRGFRAAWFPEQPWEEYLDVPVAQLRKKLHVDAPPAYQTLRTSDFAAQAA
jgi:ubiquinone biosynthesis protein COQ4